MQKSKTSHGWQKQLPDLCEAFLSLKTVPECKKFLRDLCTITEMQAMTERWQAVRMIKQGVSYREIAKKTGISTATITRVASWLKHGEKGYKIALERTDK
jgi:TrpR-related protein YerC/YecD